MTTKPRLTLLSADEADAIYEKCLGYLANVGVKVEHPKALRLLHKAGALVDSNDQRVRFSREIIEAALQSVPRELLLAGRDEHHDIRISPQREELHVATATGNVSYLDPETNTYRDADLAYAREWAQLGEVLDEIDMIFFPFPKDAPLQTADIHALKATLENTSKHVIVQPYSLESLEYLFELAVAVSGGREALKERPRISMVSCALSPLAFKPMDVEALILATRFGVPIYAASLPSAGSTSPITIAGTVLQNGIEVLASLVMSQLLEPGAPFVANPVAFTLDMANGKNLIASVEAELCQAACSQYVKDAYRLPMAAFGYATDSVLPDGQSTVDRLLLGMLVSQAGADIIAEAGQLEAGIASSPIQFIIDDTLAKILKRISKGVRVDDDTLAWKEILDTGPGGHYLEHPHTLKHCREGLRLDLFVSQARDVWVEGGSRDLCARATETYRSLKGRLQALKLPEDIVREMDQIVRRADEHLVK
jgi:trimethylamine:corrinoid methyltransferase-like protein